MKKFRVSLFAASVNDHGAKGDGVSNDTASVTKVRT